MHRRTLFGLAASAGAGATAATLLPGAAHAAPTDGWTRTDFSYTVQKPWNLNVNDRYSHSGGVHTMWVYDTDQPHTQGSPTDPRTELRWHQEFSSGQHMWDGDVFVPSGTDGPSIVQILREDRPAGTPATDIMFWFQAANGGSIRYYDFGQVLATGMANRWFNFKLAHWTQSGTLGVWIDDRWIGSFQDRGPARRYFKNGVYHHGSGRAEARFRNLKYWTK
ncbi:hypothetical protein GCM10009853_017400 [Glycomyces scopariae]